MSAMPRATRPMTLNASYLLAGQLATTALGVVLSGAIGRALGPADFGVWYVLTTILGVVYVFVDWGYPQYVIGEVSRHPDRAGDLTGTVLTLRLVTAVVISIPALLVTSMLGYDARVAGLMLLISASWLPVFLLTSFSWAFRGHERMDCESTVGVVLKVVTVAFIWGWLRVGPTLPRLIVAQGLAGAVAFAFALLLYRRVRFPSLRVRVSTAHELVRHAAPIFTVGLMVSLQQWIDATMLARRAPADVVGWYGAAITIAGTLVAPAVILSGTVYPRLSRVADDSLALARLVRATLRPALFVAVLGAVGTYLFAGFAIDAVYRRSNFGPAAGVLQAYAPSLLLISIDLLLSNAILACGRIARFARAKTVAVIVTSVLEWFLIPVCQARFGNGAIGTMLSFAAGEATLVVAALWITPRGMLGISSGLDAARAVAAGVVTLVCMRMAAAWVHPVIGIALTIAIYSLIAAAVGLVTRDDLAQLWAGVARRGDLVSRRASVGVVSS